jgi:hypothetical protein
MHVNYFVWRVNLRDNEIVMNEYKYAA